MAAEFVRADTLDDLMRAAMENILQHGEWIRPTKGAAIELSGVLLELTNPRARLSRTETRGKPYSCMGELCWYLAGTNDLGFIFYYLPAYKRYADGDEIFGGYGPRLFHWKGLNQLANVTSMLRKKPHSRQAVLQLFDAQDIVEEHKDVPCTCTLQFMIRKDRLNLLANMRSNDAFIGMAHDIFCFTMLQEIVARDLSIDIGTYKHSVGSFHLYEESVNSAKEYLSEGWQPTDTAMPPMPIGDPWEGISSLLRAEVAIRTTGDYDGDLSTLDPYWADMIRLLEVFRCKKGKSPAGLVALRGAMFSNVYYPFIDRVISQLT